ncbi:hypothetical protein D3C79_949260 [compost metagenome]
MMWLLVDRLGLDAIGSEMPMPVYTQPSSSVVREVIQAPLGLKYLASSGVNKALLISCLTKSARVSHSPASLDMNFTASVIDAPMLMGDDDITENSIGND